MNANFLGRLEKKKVLSSGAVDRYNCLVHNTGCENKQLSAIYNSKLHAHLPTKPKNDTCHRIACYSKNETFECFC